MRGAAGKPGGREERRRTLHFARSIRDHIRLLVQGGPGFVQIALTNACNAHCRFCGFSQVKPADQVMADSRRLLRGLPGLAAAGVRYIVFTGGEPLLYPHLEEVLTQAARLGFQTMVCTNGWLLDTERLESLGRTGISHLLISIDAASAEVHDRHRGLPGLSRAIARRLPHIKDLGITPVASVTVSRLLSDLETLGRFLVHLGFQLATFSYPLTRLHSSYLSYAAHESVTFTPAEMVATFQTLQGWQARAPVIVLNPGEGMRELERQLSGQPVHFPCLAGYKYFYIDWHLQIYRCHYLAQVLGPLEDFAVLPRTRDDCHACLMDCYRDASVQQHVAVALADSWQALVQGQWRRALDHLLHYENLLSLGAALHSRHWLAHPARVSHGTR